MQELRVGISISMEEAKQWFWLNNIQLNVEKTQEMLYSLWNRPNAVRSGEAVKLLGVTIDGKLCWVRHVDEVCKKLIRVNFL